MTAHSTTPASPARAVDVHALPAMLTALRLPSFHRHWPMLAERADTEGWPAARFLAALAEVEIAERETRRIRRHLLESRLPGGKTLATFNFKALPNLPRARVEGERGEVHQGRSESETRRRRRSGCYWDWSMSA